MLHRESNPGPFAWKVTTLTVDRPRLLIACTYYTTYIANLDCHELRVASLAALAPPIMLGHCSSISCFKLNAGGHAVHTWSFMISATAQAA